MGDRSWEGRMSDGSWIVHTLLDLEATDGEVEAAARAATPAEMLYARQELARRCCWARLDRDDLEGSPAHVREQHPQLAPR
jgi:hypothetical protein